MDQGPLVMDEINEAEEFVREFDKYEPVKVAFLLKASDKEYRYLYIATERIDDVNSSYGEVARLANSVHYHFFDPYRVKLISANDALAKEALDIRTRFPRSAATRLGGMPFGGIFADELYIYSAFLPTAVS